MIGKTVEIPFRSDGRDFYVYDFEGSMTAFFTFNDFCHTEMPDLKDPKVIVDIGANLGMFSLCLAHKYPGCVVYAYEPSEINYSHLNAALKKNELLNISPVNLGVSKNPKIKLYMDYHNSGACSSTSLHLFTSKGIPYHESEVNCITLRQLVDIHGHIDFMKMDIEGEEYNLSDDWSELDKVDALFIEMHAIPHDPDFKEKATRTYNLIKERMKDKFLLVKMGDEELAKELGLSCQ